MTRKRRGIEEFSVSFLDVICCGFGAIILLLLITKTVEPILLEKSKIDLDGKIAEREKTLYEIRGQIKDLNRQVEEAENQLDDNMLLLAALERELSTILGAFSTTVERSEENQSASAQLAAP